jgi:hypothetical protein
MVVGFTAKGAISALIQSGEACIWNSLGNSEVHVLENAIQKGYVLSLLISISSFILI